MMKHLTTIFAVVLVLCASVSQAVPLEGDYRMGKGPDAESYKLAETLAKETQDQSQGMRIRVYEKKFSKKELKELVDFYSNFAGHETNFSGTLIGCDYDNEGGCAEYHNDEGGDQQKMAKDFFATNTGKKWAKLHKNSILDDK